MSLILEALRKSEAERRRAQVPDLLTDAPAAAPVAVRPTPRWPLWTAGAVVVLAAGWFAMSREADAPVSTAVIPAEAGIQGDDAVAVDSRFRGDDVRETPARPAPALQRPLVVAAPAPAAPPVSNPPPATRAVPVVASIQAPPPPPPPRPEPIAAAPAPALPASAPRVERVTDLGNADRKQLPPLKLSMHMWNDVVAQRFVIIDGTRLVVGDRIGAVVVADIVPDGVLLDWNGRALKLPLR